jgi:4-azaleucine resistance transporter AzlC
MIRVFLIALCANKKTHEFHCAWLAPAQLPFLEIETAWLCHAVSISKNNVFKLSLALMRRSDFMAGVRDELPLLLGVFPFGMIYGVLALGAGLAPSAAQAMSSILFAGSAQFITVQLAGAATPWVVMILTAFIVNLRHALYSVSVAPYLSKLSPGWKALLAYLLTDEAYAVVITRYQKVGAGCTTHWYFLGAGLTLWTGWQASTAVGIFLGAQVPASWMLDFTLALTFIALVVPALKDRPAALAALSAGVTALAAYALPYKLGIILAALVGIGAGLWSEVKWPQSG